MLKQKYNLFRSSILFVWFLGFFIPVFSQTSDGDLNYIREHDILKSGVTDAAAVSLLPIGDRLQTTTYLDGLGRPLQKVSKGTATPATTGGTWGDVVQFSVYDFYGREPLKYLPYTTTNAAELGKYKTAPITEQAQYHTTVYGETAPYSNITFDNSPLNRAVNVKSSGTSWAAGNGNSASYELNDLTDNIQIWNVSYNSGDAPVNAGTYPANTLFKTIHTDENGKQVIEYTNKSGQLILTKTQIDDVPADVYTGWICVYSIYDDFGLLRYRLQPEAVKYLYANSWSFAGTNGQQVLNELCFRYEYDDKGRNILKKAPGAKELRMIYDGRDRVVFMQDGNQAAKTSPEWTANLYDELDRPTITTLYHTTGTVTDLQSAIANSVTTTTVTVANPAAPVASLVVTSRDVNIPRYVAQQSIEFTDGFVTPNSDNGFVAEIDATTTKTITVNSTIYNAPITKADLNNPSINTIVKYQFYDDYSYAGAKSFDNSFDNTTAYPNSDPNVVAIAASNRNTSFPTGSMVRVLGTNTFLTSTDFYDEKGRHIQTIEDNIKSGKDVTTLQYHWDGRLLSTHSKHTTANSGYVNFGIVTKNNFDKIGRVTSVEKNYGGNGFKKVASYDFDDVGRLKTKHLDPGYTGSGKSELEALTYSYNIHNNITGINKDYALKTPGKYDKWGNFFGVCLGYDKSEGVFFNTPQLDGHVAGIAWNTQGDDAQRKYDYTYDNAGRLARANFTELDENGLWGSIKVNFSVTGIGNGNSTIGYDLNGNILAMGQKTVVPGKLSGYIDNLVYTYASYSNKLLKVTDNTPLTTLNGSFGDFKDGTNTGDDYVYDNNGNLVTDLNKNVKDLVGAGTNGISYNFLDKPEQIKIAGKGTIKIVYDAEGNKLQKIYTPEGGGSPVTTTYINQYVYKGDDLQFINFEEGRIRIIQPISWNNGFDGANIDGNMTLPNSKKGVYDYFIRDYQENVRMILTEETHYSINTCTMESSRAANEEPVFGQLGANNEVSATRLTTKPPGWTSNTSSAVSKLSKVSGHTIGPNSLLKVMAGDVLNASADYYYPAVVTNNNNSLVTDIVTTLVQAISGSAFTNANVKAGTTGISTNLNGSVPFSTAADPNQATTDNIPRAYLNVMFFDERFKFVAENSTAVRVSQPGSGAAPLVLPINTKAPKNGYAYIYLSNENDDAVYFDNLQVKYNRGRIIEENHYYAFGLKIDAISSVKLPDPNEGNINNKNLYNDKELIDEADFNWYDYGFRNYDPQIGRFPELDPLTDDYPNYTPYQFAGNEPITNIDIDGLEPGTSITVGIIGNAATSGTYNVIARAAPRVTQTTAHAGSALISAISAASNGLRIGLDGININLNKPRPMFNNTPAPPPSSFLSPASNRGVYDEQMHSEMVGQKRLEAGWPAEGGEPNWSKLAGNKTFARGANNVVFPTIEGASLLSGGGEIVNGIRMLRGIAKAGTRAFWTGAGAEERAIQSGFQTLSQTRAGQNLIKLTEGMSWEEAQPLWQRISVTWAKGAKGPVPFFEGNNVSPFNIFINKEKPVLIQRGIKIIKY